MNPAETDYKQMWEAIGSDAGTSYLDIKFKPTYRIGLTNYVREREIYRLLDPQTDDVILDVGCASGRQIFTIATKIHEGQGVDIAQSFIDKALAYKREHGVSNADFKVAVIETLPYPDAYFTKVVCGEVIEHVFDKDVALTELLRVLKPGGKLIISVPNLNADGTLWGRLLRLVGVRSFKPMDQFSQKNLHAHGDSHVREFTQKSMRSWLESRRLTVESIKTASWIDGPYFDFLLKVPLHITPLRLLIIWMEKIATHSGLPFGRHLVLRAGKRNDSIKPLMQQ